MNNNVNVDIAHTTFKDKITNFLERLVEDKKRAIEEIEWHEIIIKALEEKEITHENITYLKDSVKETKKFVEALELRERQGIKLKEFLEGKFVLDFDRFVFLLIDILGNQMVNYVELKNEYATTAELWKTKKTTN